MAKEFSDWFPGRISKDYRDHYDETFRKKKPRKCLTKGPGCGRISKSLKKGGKHDRG